MKKSFLVIAIIFLFIKCNNKTESEEIIVLNQYVNNKEFNMKDNISYFSKIYLVSNAKIYDPANSKWLDNVKKLLDNNNYNLAYLTCNDINDSIFLNIIDEINYWEFGEGKNITKYTRNGNLMKNPFLLQLDTVQLNSFYSKEIEDGLFYSIKNNSIQKDYEEFYKAYNRLLKDKENIILFGVVHNTLPYIKRKELFFNIDSLNKIE